MEICDNVGGKGDNNDKLIKRHRQMWEYGEISTLSLRLMEFVVKYQHSEEEVPALDEVVLF